jgi:hypothetical protein
MKQHVFLKNVGFGAFGDRKKYIKQTNNNRCFSTPHKRSKKKPEAFVCVVVGVVFLIGGVLVVVALHLLPLV